MSNIITAIIVSAFTITLGFLLTMIISQKISEHLMRDSRKYMNEEDFNTTSNIKYEKLANILLYRILSALTFTSFLAFILIVNSDINFIYVITISSILYIFSIYVDITFQTLTFRRVVQGIFRGIKIQGLKSIQLLYVVFSLIILVHLVVLWEVHFVYAFSLSSFNLLIVLFILAITIVTVSNLVMKGYSRLILYGITAIIIVALYMQEVKIQPLNLSLGFSMVISFAFITSLGLIYFLYITTKRSKYMEFKSYFYETFFIIFALSFIASFCEILLKKGAYYIPAYLKINSTLVLALLYIYAFYPFTRFYSTVEKSVEDLKNILSKKDYIILTYIPPTITYIVFVIITLLMKILRVEGQQIVTYLYVPLSVMFFFEYTILIEAVTESVKIRFKENPRFGGVLALINTFMVLIILALLLPRITYFDSIITLTIVIIATLSIIYFVTFTLMTLLSIKTEIKV